MGQPRSTQTAAARDRPAVPVPETLALPEAAIGAIAGACHIGRSAVIGRSTTVIAWAITRSVIAAVLAGDGAADDGAADQSGGDTRRNAALGMGRSRRSQGRNSQGGGGGKGHHC